MKLEVLISCMHQIDDELVHNSNLTGDVLMVNQCDREGYAEYKTQSGTARIFSTTQRGLTRSRNMAIRNSSADICLLCDDDETFLPDYEALILQGYEACPDADILVFKLLNLPQVQPRHAKRLRFPHTLRVCSVQLSFRRERLIQAGIQFDELLGAGTGNGAEEELKFLLDCEKAGLKIYYTPTVIGSLRQDSSTWYDGFTERFFENRGATTRYILGAPLAVLYGIYYVLRKQPMYRDTTRPWQAMAAILRGIREDRITAAANAQRETEAPLP